MDAIAAAIVAHLQAHPLAADSADGVARWWLGPAHSTVTLQQVERALELLASRGLLRRLTLMDETILYSLATQTRQ